MSAVETVAGAPVLPSLQGRMRLVALPVAAAIFL